MCGPALLALALLAAPFGSAVRADEVRDQADPVEVAPLIQPDTPDRELPGPLPLQLSWAPGAQIFPSNTVIWGLSLNMPFGSQDRVRGASLGPFNEVKRLTGASLGLVNVSREKSTALQVGFGNTCEGKITGAQLGSANTVEGDMKGLQLGAANSNGGGAGVQIGILNHSRGMKGLQLGLLNFNEKGVLKFLPLVNWSF
jgi:hypothetical protein